jgi:hypothetical protein
VAGSLTALLLGSTVLGAGNAAIFLTRYAAAEVGGEGVQWRALGAVFFATALGAVISPFLLGPSGDVARMLGLPSLAGLYLVAILRFVTSASLLATASSPGVPYFGSGAALLGPRERGRITRGDVAAGLSARPARRALLILAASNLVMVAVMAVSTRWRGMKRSKFSQSGWYTTRSLGRETEGWEVVSSHLINER